jgi:predicted ABC-type ATPase
MSLLLVYAGPNGSGKSSLRDLGEVPDPVDEVIDPDRIARTSTRQRRTAQMPRRAGRHFIPPEIIRRRYTSSLANLPEALRLTEHATVVDNPGEIHRVVLELAGGELLHVADSIPGWLHPLMPQITRR